MFSVMHTSTNRFAAWVAFAVLLVALPMQAPGAPPELLQTFLKPTPAPDEWFGCSVAAVGGNVLVGASGDDTGATDAGAAYLFDASTGALLQTFLNPTPAVNDRFGFSVAGVGGNVLVGAWRDDTGGTDAGEAYLFDGSTGALLQTFLNPTPAAYDRFGFSLGAVGGNVLVGADHDDTGATNTGAAYLFDASTGALLQTFLNPTPAAYDYFGHSVAGVGGNVLVGAYADDTGATNAGAAYLFDASTGALLQTFQKPTPAGGDVFGSSVAGVGGNVLVGASNDDTGGTNAGAAYLLDASTGALLQTFQKPTPAAGDYFGFSVAGLAGNVLVGADHDDTGATGAGAAYLFDASTGALLQTFLNPTPAANDGFGISVAGVGRNVLVGAPGDDTGASGAGAAYLFVPGPAALEVAADIKPGSWPNPLNPVSKGVLPLAVCGSDEFDVMTIDTETLLLGREGIDGLLPLRWSYEDVATPFEGEPCDGHDLNGDGFMDLTLKFSTQELMSVLGLGDLAGQTVPLLLSGSLMDGTPLEGIDCVWVLRRGDGNMDGLVDGLDYIAWSNYYRTGTAWSEGDYTGDGYVDGLDYIVWSNNYKAGCPAAVPEPATLALLGLGVLAIIHRRRRKA